VLELRVTLNMTVRVASPRYLNVLGRLLNRTGPDVLRCTNNEHATQLWTANVVAENDNDAVGQRMSTNIKYISVYIYTQVVWNVQAVMGTS
jgi:hypothetical protein